MKTSTNILIIILIIVIIFFTDKNQEVKNQRDLNVNNKQSTFSTKEFKTECSDVIKIAPDVPIDYSYGYFYNVTEEEQMKKNGYIVRNIFGRGAYGKSEPIVGFDPEYFYPTIELPEDQELEIKINKILKDTIMIRKKIEGKTYEYLQIYPFEYYYILKFANQNIVSFRSDYEDRWRRDRGLRQQSASGGVTIDMKSGELLLLSDILDVNRLKEAILEKKYFVIAYNKFKVPPFRYVSFYESNEKYVNNILTNNKYLDLEKFEHTNFFISEDYLFIGINSRLGTSHTWYIISKENIQPLLIREIW